MLSIVAEVFFQGFTCISLVFITLNNFQSSFLYRYIRREVPGFGLALIHFALFLSYFCGAEAAWVAVFFLRAWAPAVREAVSL